MFQIIGAIAEFERSLIQERVRAGIRNARAKGKKFGRPRVPVNAARIAALRASGHSWSEVCEVLEAGTLLGPRLGMHERRLENNEVVRAPKTNGLCARNSLNPLTIARP